MPTNPFVCLTEELNNQIQNAPPDEKSFYNQCSIFNLLCTFASCRGHAVNHETENAANCMSEQRQRSILIEENQQI